MSQFDIDLAIRDAGTSDDGRTVEGVAMVYGEPIRGDTREYGKVVETFAPGSFQDAIEAVSRGERIPIVDQHFGETVGYADRLWDEAGKLRYSGRLFSMQAARDFAERAVGKVMRVSAEFLPGEVKRGQGTVTHTRVKLLAAISGSYAPAYAGTSVSVRDAGGTSVAEDIIEPVAPDIAPAPVVVPPPTVSQADIAAIAQRVADESIRTFAARGQWNNEGPVDPFAEYRALSIGELAKRSLNAPAEYFERPFSGKHRKGSDWVELAVRTLADTVTTSGANAGMVTPGVFGDIHGIVSRGRPAIGAFGGPRPVPDEAGMDLLWPYFDGTLTSLVAAQSAQKAAITSAAVDIKKGTEALNTYAGGSDISYQLLRRSSPSYLDAYYRILLTAWGVVTDAAFVTELETGSVTSDTGALGSLTAAAFKDFIIDASIAVQTATGQPAEFVLASTTGFTAMAKLLTPVTTLANTGVGTTDLRTLIVNVGGIPVIHVPSVTAGKFIISNREAAAWFEDGPFQAQEEDVEKLGRNVALWSMGAGARFIPAGIVEAYDVP